MIWLLPRKRVARTADFAVRVFSVPVVILCPRITVVNEEPETANPAVWATGGGPCHLLKPVAGLVSHPGRLAMAELQRIRGHEGRRTKETLRFDPRLRENALRSARTNLIAPSRGRKDADHKSGSPRSPLLNTSRGSKSRVESGWCRPSTLDSRLLTC